MTCRPGASLRQLRAGGRGAAPAGGQQVWSPSCIFPLPVTRIDLNGQILISKKVESEETQAIDLQWMVMACDPNSVERETCDELPVSPQPSLTSGLQKRAKPAEREPCQVTCPQGPPGKAGAQVSPPHHLNTSANPCLSPTT